MIDVDTFLTTLYVMVDDFCQEHLDPEPRTRGPAPSLSRSEVVTLILFAQFWRFRSEQDFYRYAQAHLRPWFPRLPNLSQFNRLARRHYQVVVQFFLYLADLLKARESLYEVIDTTGVPVRNVKRRGRNWLAGLANIGYCSRLGWFFGFKALFSVTPSGVITGFGFGQGSEKDQPLAETFFAVRHCPDARLPTIGKPALGPYIADSGFIGAKRQQLWASLYHAQVITIPSLPSPHSWPKKLRRWFYGIRQIVETVIHKLQDWFSLDRERPHTLSGFQVRLAAKAALHNFCIWLNLQYDRQPLAFADLLDW